MPTSAPAHHGSHHQGSHELHSHPHGSAASLQGQAVVITVSDRSAQGERPDVSGPTAADLLTAAGLSTRVVVIPDGAASVRAALQEAAASGADVIVTSGGTGVGPRDQTPEGTAPLLTQTLPGVAEALRADGARHTAAAALGRGMAGLINRTFVVNLPGSAKAVAEGLQVVVPLLDHLLDQIRGGDHPA